MRTYIYIHIYIYMHTCIMYIHTCLVDLHRHLVKQPDFAMQCALAALHWMSMGHGYELTGFDAHEAYRLAIEAAANAEQGAQAQAAIEQVLATDRPISAWLRRALGITASAPA